MFIVLCSWLSNICILRSKCHGSEVSVHNCKWTVCHAWGWNMLRVLIFL